MFHFQRLCDSLRIEISSSWVAKIPLGEGGGGGSLQLVTLPLHPATQVSLGREDNKVISWTQLLAIRLLAVTGSFSWFHQRALVSLGRGGKSLALGVNEASPVGPPAYWFLPSTSASLHRKEESLIQQGRRMLPVVTYF